MQENELSEFSEMTLCRSNSVLSAKSVKSKLSKKIQDNRNPIKINKKEIKIPYTKKTPIYGRKGYHLERDTSNEQNFEYFSKLVENKSVKSDNSENKRVRILNSAMPQRARALSFKIATQQPAAKPLSSVIIRNKSKSTENVGVLLRKSEMSSKNDDNSRLESEMPSNYDCLSQASDASSEFEPQVFDESMILNLIVKSKCGNNFVENSLGNNNQIELRHLATPFNENFLIMNNAPSNPMRSQASDASTIHRELTFLDTKKKAYLDELERFRNFEVSQYYFKNMQDLRQKLYKSTDKVLISQTSAPNNSNELFNRIEKFDVADSYKKEYFQEVPEVRRLLSAHKSVADDIRERPAKSACLKGFQSMRDFRLEPEKGPVRRLAPPLMRNRSPKKEPDYYRYKYVSCGGSHFINRAKTAV